MGENLTLFFSLSAVLGGGGGGAVGAKVETGAFRNYNIYIFLKALNAVHW